MAIYIYTCPECKIQVRCDETQDHVICACDVPYDAVLEKTQEPVIDPSAIEGQQ